MLQRKQFTFYRSFFEAISAIGSKARRAELYDIVCDYALNGTMPDMDALTAIQRSSMRLIMPVLDTARQKAEAGVLGGSKTKAKQKQTVSKGEEEIEMEMDMEVEVETETESKGNPLSVEEWFEKFWKLYPKKVGKEQARLAFKRVDVPFSVLQNAIAEQQNSIQWTRENGQYIPNPAVWLAERRWEDELPMLTGSGVKASGVMGEEEREAIRRMLAEK